MKSILQHAGMALLLGTTLAACHVDTTKETHQNADGTEKTRTKIDVTLDPAEAEAKARAAGHKIAEAGKTVGREVKEGYDKVREKMPDVDVDVHVKSSEKDKDPKPRR